MAVAYQSRLDRMKQIEKLLPESGEKRAGLTALTLLQQLAEWYKESRSEAAKLRAIQRDLKVLLTGGQIVAEDSKAKPLTYRLAQVDADADIDPHAWSYALTHIKETLAGVLPEQRLEMALKKIQGTDGIELSRQQFRIVPDTLRLLPAEFDGHVLAHLVRALVEGRTLNVTYRDRDGKETRPVLHPQAALQRGPRLYLFAMKNDESEPVRMYALHRIIKAEIGHDTARKAPEFDLESAIYSGQADFADGETIALELLVRGYVADLVRECQMGRDQLMMEEPEDSAFSARLTVKVPLTGQLFRWLLGCGDNVEVVSPAHLRNAIAVQAAKVAGIYQRDLTTSLVV